MLRAAIGRRPRLERFAGQPQRHDHASDNCLHAVHDPVWWRHHAPACGFGIARAFTACVWDARGFQPFAIIEDQELVLDDRVGQLC